MEIYVDLIDVIKPFTNRVVTRSGFERLGDESPYKEVGCCCLLEMGGQW